MMQDQGGIQESSVGGRKEPLFETSRCRRRPEVLRRVTVKQAVLYDRVSSKDQEREGHSIPAQRKLLIEYGEKHAFEIVREFTDIETTKSAGRKSSAKMVRFLGAKP